MHLEVERDSKISRCLFQNDVKMKLFKSVDNLHSNPENNGKNRHHHCQSLNCVSTNYLGLNMQDYLTNNIQI